VGWTFCLSRGVRRYFVCWRQEQEENSPVKTVLDSTLTNLSHGIMATSEEVITTRLTFSSAAADFKIPTVPLTAGWIKSRSYSVVC